MICQYKDAKPVEMVPGLLRRTLITGKSMMICEFTLEKGVEIPAHAHPHEQVGYVASGKVRITVGDESTVLGPGGLLLCAVRSGAQRTGAGEGGGCGHIQSAKRGL